MCQVYNPFFSCNAVLYCFIGCLHIINQRKTNIGIFCIIIMYKLKSFLYSCIIPFCMDTTNHDSSTQIVIQYNISIMSCVYSVAPLMTYHAALSVDTEPNGCCWFVKVAINSLSTCSFKSTTHFFPPFFSNFLYNK